MVTRHQGQTGHLLGAAGALEAVSRSWRCANDGAGDGQPRRPRRRACGVDVPEKARELTVTAAVNDSFGFGGHNIALVFHKL